MLYCMVVHSVGRVEVNTNPDRPLRFCQAEATIRQGEHAKPRPVRLCYHPMTPDSHMQPYKCPLTRSLAALCCPRRLKGKGRRAPDNTSPPPPPPPGYCSCLRWSGGLGNTIARRCSRLPLQLSKSCSAVFLLPVPKPANAMQGRSQGGERRMGTTAYGGKGSKGRAANGDRPVGAASCRREQHTMASCQPPPPRGPCQGREPGL